MRLTFLTKFIIERSLKNIFQSVFVILNSFCHKFLEFHVSGSRFRLRLTLMVSSIDKNFLLSPMSMALLISGTASFTASSVGTGGMFSPPAVMMSSGNSTTGQ